MLIFMTLSEGAAAAAEPRHCCSQGVTLCAILVPLSSGEDAAQACLCIQLSFLAWSYNTGAGEQRGGMDR